MSEVTVAATQMACSENIDENIAKAESLIRQAAKQGAQIILLQELFLTPYFCKDEKKEYFELAQEVKNNETDTNDLLAKAQKDLLDIVSKSSDKAPADIKSVIESTKKMSDDFRARGFSGFKIGFKFLENAIGSYMVGQLWVIAAWTSIGKTSWMTESICRINRNNAFPHILVVSTEMTRESNLLKIIANKTQISPFNILNYYSGKLSVKYLAIVFLCSLFVH